VTDSSGAVVPAATVTITDDSTKVAIQTQSNHDGVFIEPDLNVATYTVTFAKAGFKSYTVTGVELHPTVTVHGERSACGRRDHPDRDGASSLHRSGDLHSRGFGRY
jgi:hypothetical protein